MRRTSILAMLSILAAGGPAAAGDDAPALAAVVEGDPALVAMVSEDLARRGITLETPADDEADAVHVTLTRQSEGGILLSLRDRYGRGAERVVATDATAATLIESWTRRELAEPLLAPRAPAVAAAAPAPPPRPETIATRAPSPASQSALRLSLRLAGEISATDDHAWWTAASGAACSRLGPVCLGAEARFARRTYDDGDRQRWRLPEESQHQSDVQGLVTAEVPVDLGWPVLIMGFGVGAGRRSEGEWATFGPRGEVRAVLAVPLWSKLAFDVGLAATLAPSSSGRDPLAAGPRPDEGLLRAGLGLRWGRLP